MTALVLALVLPGGADEPPPPRIAVTVLALPHDVPEEAADRILRSLGRGLAKNPRLDVKDAAKLMADFSGDVPTEEVEAARDQAKVGEDLLSDMRTREAIGKLAEAVKRLEAVMPFIHKQELADATMSLAVAEALEGNRAAARNIFADLLVWRPKVDADATRVPPNVMRLYEEARKEVARLPRGSVEIRSEPDGALAYVDGHLIGQTPATAEGLTVGHHFVTLKKEGFLKRVIKAMVSGKEQETVTGKLEPSKKYLLLQQAIERSKDSFGAEQAVDAMVELRSFLFIDQVIFVKLSNRTSGAVEMDVALYDLRSRRRLSRVRQVVAKDRDADNAAQTLYVNVPYDGSLQAPAPEKPPEVKKRRPFYGQWWFWTAVGAAAAAAVVIPLETLPEDRSTPGYRGAVITFPP